MSDLVSVIMPTYKRNLFLKRAIESVLEQTYKYIELVIVDDNGADTQEQQEAQKIVQTYTGDKRVKYVVNTVNVGGSISRNIGVANSKGNYITFLDDDDVYNIKKIEIQYLKMCHNNLDISIVNDIVKNAIGKIIKKTSRNLNEFPSKQDLMVEHLMHHVSGTNDIMITRNFFEQIGGFKDIESGQEYMLILDGILENCKFGYIPEILVTYYEHNEGRISTSIKKINGQKKLMSTKEKYFNYLSKSQIKYVKCRNHIVCAYIYWKNHQYSEMIKEFTYALNISIYNCILIIGGY